MSYKSIVTLFLFIIKIFYVSGGQVVDKKKLYHR